MVANHVVDLYVNDGFFTAGWVGLPIGVGGGNFDAALGQPLQNEEAVAVVGQDGTGDDADFVDDIGAGVAVPGAGIAGFPFFLVVPFARADLVEDVAEEKDVAAGDGFITAVTAPRRIHCQSPQPQGKITKSTGANGAPSCSVSQVKIANDDKHMVKRGSKYQVASGKSL